MKRNNLAYPKGRYGVSSPVKIVISHFQLALFPPLDESKSVSSDLVRGHFSDDQVLADFSDSAACTGHYVHVFVDPKNGNRPIQIPDPWKSELGKIKS